MCAPRQGGTQLDPQALSLLRRCQTASQATCRAFSSRRPNRALHGSTSLFVARALLAALKGRPPGYTVPCEIRWTGGCRLFTGVVYGDGSAYDGQDADLCVVGLGFGSERGRRAARYGLRNAAVPHPRCRRGSELFGLRMLLRIAHAPAQYVTDSSFVEQGANQRGRKATEASTSAWADLWHDVWCEIRCLGRLGRHPLSAQGEGAHHS